jgi:hypothetical protein
MKTKGFSAFFKLGFRLGPALFWLVVAVAVILSVLLSPTLNLKGHGLLWLWLAVAVAVAVLWLGMWL